MKKIEYEAAFGSLSKMIDIYRGKIKEALEERNIAVVYFGNAPAVNPSDDEYFDCYSLLKYENGEMLLADGCGLEEYPEVSTILTTEQVASGEINNCHFAKAFAKANWQLWDDVEEEGPNSWDSLYYCLCEAINECADEE